MSFVVDDKPTQDLLNLHVRDNLCSSKGLWRDLGYQLLDKKYHIELKIIETNYSDVRECCFRMFEKWIQSTPSEACTWGQLIKILYKINLIELAEKLQYWLQPAVERDGPISLHGNHLNHDQVSGVVLMYFVHALFLCK